MKKDNFLILNTSLGDFLSVSAAQLGIPKQDLEKRIKLVRVEVMGSSFFSGLARGNTMKMLEEATSECDAVVEVREYPGAAVLGAMFEDYTITATGIKNLYNK